MSDDKTEHWKRPLEVRMDPREPFAALVIWKGQPLGCLRDVQVSVDEETAKVRIVRSAYTDRTGTIWQEMRDAGIEVEDAERREPGDKTPEEHMAIIQEIRLATLNEVLTIIEKIIAEPVLRDGSKAKHIKIRDAVRALVLGPKS